MDKVKDIEKDLEKEVLDKNIDNQEENAQKEDIKEKELNNPDSCSSEESPEEKLTKEIEDLKAKVQAEKNDYLRLMAEFETFRRRSAEERLSLISSASADTIKGLLPVLDDCERAMELLSQSSDEAAKKGTSLILDKLMAYLKAKGLEKIDAKGKQFDTDFHEAVAQIPCPEGFEKSQIIDVVESGYLLNGKVLRFAKVVVGI